MAVLEHPVRGEYSVSQMPPASPPWWIEKLAIPGFFIFVGASVGWAIAELKDKLQARRFKKAFLRAIGLELDAICAQLDSFDKIADGSLIKLQTGGGAPHLAGVLRRAVFNSQLSKLRDVDDPLVMEIIMLYSDLGTIDQVVTQLNQQAADLAKLASDVTTSSVYVAPARARAMSALLVLKEESGRYHKRAVTLREKLPSRSK